MSSKSENHHPSYESVLYVDNSSSSPGLPGEASKISRWPTAFLSMLFSMLLLLLASDNSRASLSLAIPVTSSDSLILVLIFLVVVEAVAEEAIEAVGNGGNFG